VKDQANTPDIVAGYAEYVCVFCGSHETTFHQYVDGGSWYCAECGRWRDESDTTKTKEQNA